MLTIRNLHATINDTEILRGIDLEVRSGEVHAIMGPNGSGKSTLAYALVGHPSYQVTAGEVTYDERNLLEMTPEERAQAGVFLSFQHPVDIPGVRLDHFIREGVNAIRRSRGEEEVDILRFDKYLKKTAKMVDLDASLLKRWVNEGFSGGERKRAEILQMLVLEPRLAILDEPDSGLDVDALRGVAEGINALRSPERAVLLITHYQRILDYVVPDRVHVLINGRIVRSGDRNLAREIEAEGYDRYLEAEMALGSGS